jgi:hypothetical protein
VKHYLSTLGNGSNEKEPAVQKLGTFFEHNFNKYFIVAAMSLLTVKAYVKLVIMMR